MTKRNNLIVLSTTDYKILQTIFLLNKENKYPLPEGVKKILNGEKDDETLQYQEYPTYMTLISYSSKKISRYILMLLRYKYLEKIYDKTTDELYLKITRLGEDELNVYLRKHHPHFKKREQVSRPTIVEIK